MKTGKKDHDRDQGEDGDDDGETDRLEKREIRLCGIDRGTLSMFWTIGDWFL